MRKMIIRADDVGYTDFCNIGTFEAIDGGMVTSADVMLDGFGCEDALRRLRDYPWISVGWHNHCWCAPVLGAERVPSLVEQEGVFRGRFRLDLDTAEDIVYEEALAELRAQLDRCLDILGKVPDTAQRKKGLTPFARACSQVIEEYHMVTDFADKQPTDERALAKIRKGKADGEAWAAFYPENGHPAQKADPKWADRRILILDGSLPYMDLWTDSVSEVEEKYDPVLYYTEDRPHMLQMPEDLILEQSWHPGYVDYTVYRMGERGKRARAQQFVVGRTQDVAALTDDRLRRWIVENEIELVNFRDALYGTGEFQNHLARIGSSLAVRGRGNR